MSKIGNRRKTVDSNLVEMDIKSLNKVLSGKRVQLILEEGLPEYIQQALWDCVSNSGSVVTNDSSDADIIILESADSSKTNSIVSSKQKNSSLPSDL